MLDVARPTCEIKRIKHLENTLESVNFICFACYHGFEITDVLALKLYMQVHRGIQ